MIRIEIDIALGRAKFQRLLKFFDEATILQTVKLRLLGWMDENLRKAGIEHRWPPLRPITVMLQRRQRTKPLESWAQKLHGRPEEGEILTSRTSRNEVWVGFASGIQRLAAIHHFGSRPYVIEPVRKRVLAAALPGGLRVSLLGASGSAGGTQYLIFGKRVQHPGIPRRPLIQSEGLAKRLISETLNAALDAALKGQAGK